MCNPLLAGLAILVGGLVLLFGIATAVIALTVIA